MSKNYVKPFKALNFADMGQATQTSAVTDIRYMDDVAIQLNFALTAFGTITISAGAGAITATINGIAVSGVTWATSDTLTAAALAAAINATGTLAAQVFAKNVAGVVTILSKATGTAGNAYTLAATGTGVSVSGATFTAGTAPVGSFAVQASLDYDENMSRVVINPGNWVSLPLNPAPIATGTSPDTIFIELNQLSSPFIRVVYTRTSGNGILDAYVTAKAI